MWSDASLFLEKPMPCKCWSLLGRSFLVLKDLTLFLSPPAKKKKKKKKVNALSPGSCSVPNFCCPASDCTTESCCHSLVRHWPTYGSCAIMSLKCFIPALSYSTLLRYTRSLCKFGSCQAYPRLSSGLPACKLFFSSQWLLAIRILWGKLLSRIYYWDFLSTWERISD